MSWRERALPNQREDIRQEYQVMIDYIKDQVGEGREYLNDLVRVVLSDRGCYYEFRDLPEEFSGAVGSGFHHEFVGTEAGLSLLDAVHDLVLAPESPDTHEISLMVIYKWDGLFRAEDAFIYHWRRQGGIEEGPSTAGFYRSQVLPIFFKLKIEGDSAERLIGASKGVLFFVANLSDQHLLVRIPHHGAGVADLNDVTGARTIH
jgi:hypothetical protein